ncbi:antitoxin CcdA [Geoalkalibacter ferrihydriticus]|uniref:Post-segregation antitoxin CcdA n=2 Tax=Geoalkalibacter ferrihydriticus TaxID=392333 RepID=A0A0C2HTL4_9BACT|nr:type II toxin-antitoxin system CcdA family antitoxin [Geoalkalibacter ferrihydriticus]KIH76162.1 post-segregation antitoxin CcdA [Geoalkalibacter ferrihydriticus DSM 17813]SDM41781.1 antitoxin CcdA [Geoalkalibacter ferrihydriticus]
MSVVEKTSRVLRRAANVSINEQLLAEARDLKVNISRAAEDGLARAVAARRGELWLEQNRAALESSNDYVERHGLPLARYRGF